ncbi:helix-turn-helix domain-containing protein [Macrococcus sp. EM39E]|uniref:helix-turn-helix domain-containing protein n=1 Tax=Macrococcus animalis TaxID=3395467 RepID=UPI0039BE5C24
MTFGERLKELRVKKGWTQEQLGERIGVQKAAINKYEKGLVKNPKDKTVNQLAELFNVSPAFLRGYEDEYLKVGKKLYNIALKKYPSNTQSGKALLHVDGEKLNELIRKAVKEILEFPPYKNLGVTLDNLNENDHYASSLSSVFVSEYEKNVKTNINLISYVHNKVVETSIQVDNYNIINKPLEFEKSSLFTMGKIELIDKSIDENLMKELSDILLRAENEIVSLQNKYTDLPPNKVYRLSVHNLKNKSKFTEYKNSSNDIDTLKLELTKMMYKTLDDED